MTEKEQQSNFAERLERIGTNQDSEKSAVADMVARHKDPSRFEEPPQEDVFVRNALIWLAITISAVIGGVYGIRALPQDFKDNIAWMTGNSEEPSDANSTALAIVETDKMSFLGPILASPDVASASGELFDLASITGNIALPTDDTQIGNTIPFDRNVSCTLRKPLATENLVNIRVENGLLPTPVQAFSAQALSDQLMQNITAVTQDGQAYDHDAQVNGNLTSIDVFLTDNTAPLYLALQNMGPGIIWNIHAAPDVTVAHVALISSHISGVTNIADTTTVDGVLVSDFVAPYAAGDDDQIRDCMIRPWRNPQPDWTGVQRAAAGDASISAQMHSYSTGYAAYNAWFTDTLGVDAATDVLTIRDAAHLLHGPQPTEPIAYKPLAGQDIHLMRTDHIITGDTNTRSDAVAQLHQQTLLAAVAGRIEDLNPGPIERENQ